MTPPPANASNNPCQREWINTQQIACIIKEFISIQPIQRPASTHHFFRSISAKSSRIFCRSFFDVFSFPNNAIIIVSTDP